MKVRSHAQQWLCRLSIQLLLLISESCQATCAHNDASVLQDAYLALGLGQLDLQQTPHVPCSCLCASKGNCAQSHEHAGIRIAYAALLPMWPPHQMAKTVIVQNCHHGLQYSGLEAYRMLSTGIPQKKLSIIMLMQGIKATRSKPNPYLYQALALMATELGYAEEARQWFMEGTKTLLVCSLRPVFLKHDGIIMPFVVCMQKQLAAGSQGLLAMAAAAVLHYSASLSSCSSSYCAVLTGLSLSVLTSASICKLDVYSMIMQHLSQAWVCSIVKNPGIGVLSCIGVLI